MKHGFPAIVERERDEAGPADSHSAINNALKAICMHAVARSLSLSCNYINHHIQYILSICWVLMHTIDYCLTGRLLIIYIYYLIETPSLKGRNINKGEEERNAVCPHCDPGPEKSNR